MVHNGNKVLILRYDNIRCNISSGNVSIFQIIISINNNYFFNYPWHLCQNMLNVKYVHNVRYYSNNELVHNDHFLHVDNKICSHHP